MKRVTRSMADEAATELANLAYSKKVDELDKQIEYKVNELIIKYVPQPILSMAQEYSNLLEMDYSVCFCAENGCALYLHPKIKVPKLRSLLLSLEDYKSLKSLLDTRRSTNDAWRDYKSRVSDILCLELRTEKRIQEIFPEALPFLNFSNTTTLACNYNELRSLLNTSK